MLKKFKAIIILAAVAMVSALCAGLVACSADTELDIQKNKADVLITYDANGGNFFGRSGVTIIDSYQASNLVTDSDGKAHIKLIEPTSSSRPKPAGATAITVSYKNHFLSGWYTQREVVTNSDGVIIDDDGHELTEDSDGNYYYTEIVNDVEQTITSQPAYTYDGLWDFDNDEVVYDVSQGKYELTLYAGWVSYFQFEYYQQVDGEWVVYEKSSFDWQSATKEGSSNYGNDIIYTPEWMDGAMTYTHTVNGKNYTFPKINGTTFLKAYSDEACTQEIGTSFQHQGYVDVAHGSAVNRTQKIYVVVEQGERYYISTAQQLSDYANSSAYYEIMADLDFKNGEVTWPSQFMSSEFTGKIYSTEGHTYTIKNISATYSNSSAKIGGLFGSIAKGATIQNINFENVTFDLYSTGSRLSDTSYGLFSGNIDEAANISGVNITNATFKIGSVTLGSGYSLNLLAGGKVEGITCDEVTLQVYGKYLSENSYNYTVDIQSIVVAENGSVTLSFLTRNIKEQSIYTINVWRQNNEEK
jgi:hypothetical protein